MNKIIKLILLIVFIVLQQACGQIEKEEDVKQMLEYYNSAQYDKALVFVNKLIQNNPKSATNWTMKGRILFNLERKDEALAAINKAIEVNPKHYKAYEHRAAMYSLEGKTEEALSDINIALKDNPNDYELSLSKVNHLYNLAQFNEVIQYCDKILKANSNSYDILVYKSAAYKKLENYTDALTSLNKAIEISPQNAFAYEEKANMYCQTEEHKYAVENFTKAIERIPNTDTELLAFAYNNRGFSLYKLGENGKALADINHSLELLPTNSYAYRNLALISIDMEGKSKTCKYLEKALELGFTEKYGNEVQTLIDTNCK